MRVIEKRIVKALKGEGKPFIVKKDGAAHDAVRMEHEAFNDLDYAIYELIGTRLASISAYSVLLGCDTDWNSVTTKSRINAIADAYGLPRVYQKNYDWTWGDGVPYEGPRLFVLDK